MAENGSIFNGLIPSREELGLPSTEEVGETIRSGQPDVVDRGLGRVSEGISESRRRAQQEINDLTSGGGLDDVEGALGEAASELGDLADSISAEINRTAEAFGLEADKLLELICYPLEMLEFFIAEALDRLLRKKASVQRIAEQLERFSLQVPNPLPDISGLIPAINVDAGLYNKLREACPELGLPPLGAGDSLERLRRTLSEAYSKLADALEFHPFSFFGQLIGLLDGLVGQLVSAVNNFIVGSLGSIGNCLCALCGTQPCASQGISGNFNAANFTSLIGALGDRGSLPIWEDWKDFIRENGDDPFRWSDPLTESQREKYDEITAIKSRLRELANLNAVPEGEKSNLVTSSVSRRGLGAKTAAQLREEQLDAINAAMEAIDENVAGPGFIYTPAILETRRRLEIV